MSDKTFAAIGIVTKKSGIEGVRVANDPISQTKRFHKQGRGRVEFHDLPNAMSKLDAIAYAKTMPQFQSPADQALLDDTLVNLSGRKSKASGEKRVKAPKAAKPSLDAIAKRGKKVVEAA